MKIKIIDLLNKLANGEEVPAKFTYKGFLWEYDIRSKMWFMYYQKNGETLNHRLDKFFFLNLCLNDEVEVVEEDKLIELLDYEEIIYYADNKEIETKREVSKRKIVDKINEIIKKVNKMQKCEQNVNKF